MLVVDFLLTVNYNHVFISVFLWCALCSSEGVAHKRLYIYYYYCMHLSVHTIIDTSVTHGLFWSTPDIDNEHTASVCGQWEWHPRWFPRLFLVSMELCKAWIVPLLMVLVHYPSTISIAAQVQLKKPKQQQKTTTNKPHTHTHKNHVNKDITSVCLHHYRGARIDFWQIARLMTEKLWVRILAEAWEDFLPQS